MAAMIATKSKKDTAPSYRQRKGYSDAIVTLTDALTKKRKDYWLGEFGSAASHENYHRIMAEWESRGRRLPPAIASPTNGDADAHAITVNELVLAYWKHAESYYTPAAAGHIKLVIRLVRKFYGHSPAKDFGPNDLRLVRDAMVKGDPKADPPRKPWSRKYVNSQTHRLARIFNWGASHEMLPVEVYHRLKSVAALRRGRSDARETQAVKPVPIEMVNAVRPYLSRQVAALMDLQLLTGARGGELFKLRPIDIQMDKKKGIWKVELAEHKTAHLNRSRTLYLGPKAQKAIKPFLVGRAVNQCLFSPTEAEQERRTALSTKRKTSPGQGNTIGTNRVAKPRKKPGAHYTASSYRKAIASACSKAGIARWHPHRLRHSAASFINEEFGLEAARITLGHSSAMLTDAIYAERDAERAIEIMMAMG
jgi:integrase